MTLADHWPLVDLAVTSGDLTLRYVDDELLPQVAALAARGVHAPDAMPFYFPWTRGSADDVARSVLTYHWRTRAETSPDRWALELALIRDGEVLGVQGMTASDFPVLRTAETGSWLGLEHHGQGLGTRMRLMILHLLFDGLGAERATTGAFADNPASLGVTRKLGYRANGDDRLAREGVATTSLRFALDRADWQTRPEHHRPPIELHGVPATRELLGLP
ncbi:GNAT family N-acetyltransferase [Cellulomonas sp. HZM]|uniref:GNAT family N-acetyltransferase n=1 Tax=Cellulomonas sp. HZM TaxID=1454010 RepID=UPI00049311E8|nr:GNAT family protein [Cellulomonas sp. HZM]